ncbi:hypothetical protein D9O40_06480 [Clostridium autoethanogenum]|uniref:NADPH-dependent FMN reductase-like domain-containing protein n=1 Tax=Clostridium autoethanogenum TaxID=84023 RepID=A0A3M0SUV5_9CLOT|nr:NAD(P)H-dependent oxidoreductase [Clostridium autoethanogenum]RMD02283.1 hypothetical protein D9O40_06480 [Clostridium autoethanogenum]
MNENILVMVGSPQKKRGNSEAIADSLINKLNEKKLNVSKLCLQKEIGSKDNALIKTIDKADIIILSLPIYENSVPGLVVEIFEQLYRDKDELSKKSRSVFVITNSGFSEVEGNKSAKQTCKLFARDMNFKWMGGIGVAPGTLIDGKKLEETGKTYKRLNESLDTIVNAIENDIDIPKSAFKIMEKPFISPFIYRIAGRVLQRSTIKKLGKGKFFSTPLQMENR